MLTELRVENLLLIERAELRLGAGLIAITGETGAGKTVLAHALDLLLGGRPRSGIVRPGASEAYVEGVFSLSPDALEGDELADLRARLPDDNDELVLGRRVGTEGRTRAFVQGRSASAADLQQLGGRLLAFFGQHEHRKLTVASAQLNLLDGFCGAEHLALRDRYAGEHRRAGVLRRYADGLDAEPGRLDEVESRLGGYDRLKRKHGGTVEAVLAHADHCRAELARLESADVDLGRYEQELGAATAQERALTEQLTEARSKAAPRLARAVREELAQLAMADAQFDVRLEPRDELGAAGADRAEFVVAPNPGVPAGPLREIASGGELSRVMLALMSVAGTGGADTLVFDEVDAGVGGQTARAVGERLRRLASGRQVLCITHLPQIAALADAHFRIEKETSAASSQASVEALEGQAVVAELCRMLGADTSDAGARRHARQLLAAAA